MPKLTKRTVEALQPKEKEYQIVDSEIPGFGVRVFPTGRKIYFIQYRHGAKTRRYTIGHYTHFTAEDARLKAATLLAAARNGEDPAGDKLAHRAAPTVKELSDRYLDEHCAHHVKPKTMVNYKRILNAFILPAMSHLKVAEVTKSDIANIQQANSARKINANRIIEVCSKMFNLAELWGWRPDGTNPCRHLKKFKENKRERYLTPDELRRLGEALNNAEDKQLLSIYAIACIRLLVLTGARLGEIQYCKWEWVELDKALIRLPDSKTGAKVIPLGRTAVSILQDLPRTEGNPHVICSNLTIGSAYVNMQKAWRHVRSWAKLNDVRLHDLRHTFASSAVNMGLSLPIIGKILGHSQTQTTARYAHLAIHPAVEAATKVNDEMGQFLQIASNSDKTEYVEIISELTDQNNTRLFHVTPEQAAKHLGVTRRLLDNWRWRGVGPTYTKVGSRIRYAKAALEDFVNSPLQRLSVNDCH